MGNCTASLSLSNDLYATLKINPDAQTLIVLQLHYDLYDPASQKKIDELCQLSISANHTITLSNSVVPVGPNPAGPSQ
jgi:hypothetical protein